MINLLTSPLPDSITVDGKEYPINTDFRVWIKIEELLGSSIPDTDKLIGIFSLAFINKIPPNGLGAIKGIMQFFSPFAPSKSKEKQNSAPPLFSFSYDGGFIYAAFLSQYGIDLTSATLHWWRFLALFTSLNSCKFTDILRIRGLSLSSVNDPNQKSQLRHLKRIYRLPNALPDISSELGKLI